MPTNLFKSRARVFSRIVRLFAYAGLSGCMVGPDYVRPALDPADGYRNPGEVAVPAAQMPTDTQRLSSSLEVTGRWWEEFGSPTINQLVGEAIAKNPDLASAQAALRAARSSLMAQRSALFPQIDAGLTASRQRNSGTLASPLNSNAEDYSLYTGQVNIIYAPDVFGGVHRQIETVAAQAENQQFAVEAAFLTLTTNVVVAAIQVASLRAQIQANENAVESGQGILEALNLQKRLGESSGVDVAAQETLVSQAKALLPPLRKQLGQQEHLLAQLTGTTPSRFQAIDLDLEAVRLPAVIPLSLPSKLVEQRPDIRAADANVHAASAQVGVAIANRLPNISLSAAFGGASTGLGSLLSSGNGLWAVTGALAQPIFDAGALREKQKSAEAQLDQTQAQYRSVVLTAFQNVADTLLALDQDGRALSIALEAGQAARKSLAIARMRLEQGEGNFSAVLNAQQADQLATSNTVQAKAARLADTVGLYQALGGGWWQRGAGDLTSHGKVSIN